MFKQCLRDWIWKKMMVNKSFTINEAITIGQQILDDNVITRDESSINSQDTLDHTSKKLENF